MQFTKAPSPVYGEAGVTLRYYTFDLLWHTLGRLVRFVWVIHSTRGRLVLLCTDLTMDPLEINLHAKALTCMTSSGGKMSGRPGRGRFSKPSRRFLEETFTPLADNLSWQRNPVGNLVVPQALGGQEDRLGVLSPNAPGSGWRNLESHRGRSTAVG
jgi:hypothetical protein